MNNNLDKTLCYGNDCKLKHTCARCNKNNSIGERTYTFTSPPFTLAYTFKVECEFYIKLLDK